MEKMQIHINMFNFYKRALREMSLNRQLTPVPSAFTGIWLIKLEASVVMSLAVLAL